MASARARARRRLLGAIVLLGVGIVAFPLLFETEPRPIPVDLPIEIPPRDALPPLTPPPAGRGGRVESTPTSAEVAAHEASAPSTGPEDAASTRAAAETAPDAPLPAPPAVRESAKAPPPPPPATPARATDAEGPKPDVAAAKPAPAPAAANEGARARALLEGKPQASTDAAAGAASPTTAAPASARFVVQVGAFADAQAVRDVRARVERLGLRTYTQVVHVAAGDRTRVRIGPYDQREQAEATVARLKKAGIDAAVMAL